jgi:hypothetical protein
MLLEKEGILPFLDNWTDKETRLPPHLNDLECLYQMIRNNGSRVVWEFGCGYSSLVIAKALEKNKAEWDGDVKPFKSDKNFFTLNIIEANNDGRWLAGTLANMKIVSVQMLRITTSPVMAGTFRDMICHYYTRLPNYPPDFIYLDGPDPKHVNGNIRGVHFNQDTALPMAADLLFVEPILLPGTIVLIDGRTSNVRFLQRNFQRVWEWGKIPDQDTRWCKLREESLCT